MARRLVTMVVVLFLGIAIGANWMALNYQLY